MTLPGAIQLRDEWAHATGYSMNYMPSLSASHPAAWKDASIVNGVPSSEWFNISFSPPCPPDSYNKQYGTWWKLSQIKDGQHRCFLADSTYLMLVAWESLPQVPAGAYRPSRRRIFCRRRMEMPPTPVEARESRDKMRSTTTDTEVIRR